MITKDLPALWSEPCLGISDWTPREGSTETRSFPGTFFSGPTEWATYAPALSTPLFADNLSGGSFRYLLPTKFSEFIDFL